MGQLRVIYNWDGAGHTSSGVLTSHQATWLLRPELLSSCLDWRQRGRRSGVKWSVVAELISITDSQCSVVTTWVASVPALPGKV